MVPASSNHNRSPRSAAAPGSRAELLPAGLRRYLARIAVVGFFVSTVAVPTAFFPGDGSAASPDRLVPAGDRNSGRVNLAPHRLPQNRAGEAGDPDLLESPQGESAPTVSRTYPAPKLEPVNLAFRSNGTVQVDKMPEFSTTFAGKVAGISPRNDFVFYSLDPDLQKFTQELLRKSRAPHVAVVAMEPDTGKILAIAEKSNSIGDLSLHTGFPAASIFKIVTAAAALEEGSVAPGSQIRFRGGNYTLNQWNYNPIPKKDSRSMSLYEALAKSCNPVFGRVALKYLSPDVLRQYAGYFGFNTPLGFDFPLPRSAAVIPESDYELSRTAAGFGDVKLSPIHAATLMAGVANEGILPRPSLIERVVSRDGAVMYQSRPSFIQRLVRPETADSLMRMMEYTTTIGTSRREFMKKNRPVLPGIRVAAKTGTLSGKNPVGVNNWFVAAAPIENPRIALSVIVVNPQGIDTKASHLGRLIIQKYLGR
jgi:peptidoglycan glycosyltransferase